MRNIHLLSQLRGKWTSIQLNWNSFFYLPFAGSLSISISQSHFPSLSHGFLCFFTLSLTLDVWVCVSFPIFYPSFKSEFYLHRFYRCHIALRLDFSLKFNWLSLNCYTFHSLCIPSHFGTTCIFIPSNRGTSNSSNFHVRCSVSRFITYMSNTRTNDKSTEPNRTEPINPYYY